MNIFSHRKEINVLKWRKTPPIIWGKKGFVSKMPFTLSFFRKRAQIIVGQFYNHHPIFPKMLLLWVTTYFTLFLI